MYIAEIHELTNGRRKIVLDDGSSFVLYKGELAKNNLEVNSEIDACDYKKIMEEILPKRAKLRGLNLLKSRPYTEYQMRQKYIDGGYPKAVIEEAINYLKNLKLIDDREYCRVFMIYHSARKSRKRMANDLMFKGVSRDIIDEICAELEANGDMTEEEELVKKFIAKRHYDKENASFEEQQKMLAYLYGKGVSVELARKYL